MPIRINLLAEAQAAEELRRKDPVKRALMGGILLVALVLFWSSTLQIKIITCKSELKSLQTKWKSIDKSYEVAVDSKRKSIEIEDKLTALQQLKTNRFLWGTVLNAFQQTLGAVDDVQIVRLKADQVYAQSDDKGGKKPTSTEKISFVIDAVDASAQPGGQVTKFKEGISSVPYFHNHLQKTNAVLLTSLSAPTMGPLGRNPYVMFTLQCYFPEKVR